MKHLCAICGRKYQGPVWAADLCTPCIEKKILEEKAKPCFKIPKPCFKILEEKAKPCFKILEEKAKPCFKILEGNPDYISGTPAGATGVGPHSLTRAGDAQRTPASYICSTCNTDILSNTECQGA